jgi:splicing factor 3A subunit 1
MLNTVPMAPGLVRPPIPGMTMTGMAGLSGMAGLAGMPPAPPPADGPDAKRAKTELPLVREDIWMKLHPDPIDIRIQVPDDPSHHKNSFYGQIVTIVDRQKTSTIKDLKDELVKHLAGLGANKIKLTHVKHGVLKDAMTIAHYNFHMGESLMAAVKERGGKEKH